MPHRCGARTCAHQQVRWINQTVGKCVDCEETINRDERGVMLGSIADQVRAMRLKKVYEVNAELGSRERAS